ncbi:CoA transferase [Xanthobacter sp. VNH20]|uniref:CaiB/BaiF CoA-transferase family protein n=1 Tax=Xanthobacter sp. VNH20 TaxID=3156616 RepID=UPI0032B4F86E
MTLTTPFSDLVVLEWGRRPAVRGCGSLLAQAGAQVTRLGAAEPTDPFARFKSACPDTPEARAQALAAANVVLYSSDRGDEPPPGDRRPDQIFCDITVGGGAGRGAWTDPLLQAAAGVTHITGTPQSAPTISHAPVIELQTAIFAAAGILAAWPRLAATGEGQDVALSLLDCGLNSLSSFLPLVFAGKGARRSGNRHPMAVPWNSYRASDGWILLCSATDEHWVRLCAVMGRTELATGPFEKLAARVDNCDAVDAQVEAWTRTRTVEACVSALNAAGLAAGPILTLEGLARDPNIVHRASVSAAEPRIPLSFLKTAFDPAPPRPDRAAGPRMSARPLDGLRVVEIGQYTTAPLVAKQLALLGAEVIKIEPPGGEASRAWPPHQDGQGYFFTMNNANKRSCLLDLRTEGHRRLFARLLEQSDVLIENLKPGSIDRLGFSPAELARLNPRLVHCSISGFGRDSAYPGRPAFDTVVQAMSGLMDVTRADGLPVKLGISAADVTGGIAGLFAVMCGLEQRRRTGRGTSIDLAMQDVAVWLTQALWNSGAPADHCVLACADGFVVAARTRADLGPLADGTTDRPRAEVIATLEANGIAASAVRTLEEIAADETIVGDGTVAMFTGADGKVWPLFRSPYRFSAEQISPLAPIGGLGEANDYVSGLCPEPMAAESLPG